MNDLDKLAIKYGADKFGKHSYTPFYNNLFASKRNMVKSILEIGIAEGASLFMWRDYFPNATIYGADIDLERVKNLTGKDSRIKVFDCDQSSVPDLQHLIDGQLFLNNIDIVIDDGSHKPEDQILTCKVFMATFPKDITYIIEDVADENADKILNELSKKYICETHKFGKRYDDRLIVVRHEI